MKKYLSLFMVIVLIFTLSASMAGCKKAVNNNVVNAKITEYLVAEKVGTINRDNFSTCEGGLYYKEDDKYGVMSYEGLHDTGAIYVTCTNVGKYFKVGTQEENTSNISSINSKGLIDGKGRVIIPAVYANFHVVNSRYIMAYKATERTYVDDDSVIFTYRNYDTNEEAMYKGVWYVYDTVTGTTLPGVSGTTLYYGSAYGNYFSYKNADGNYVKVDPNGNAISNDAKVFSDGSMAVEGKVGDVYDPDGVKIFSYDITGFEPSDITEDGEYYIARKYVDGVTKYVVMDKKGMIVSAEFSDYITVYGKLIHCGNKIYNFEGNVVIEGDYNSVYYDKMFGQSWIIRQDKAYTMIDANGGVFFAGVEDDDHNVWISDFVANERKEGNYYFYSFKDNGYTIQGYSFAPWIVKTSGANYTYNLVDTMTGKNILEGYTDYSYTARSALSYYVYAKYNGGAEVYLIVSNAQLADVSTKKTNLFDDLIAAFAAEGIKVSVDKETGEMALDSSVLFGGDSAVLTADGKAFLNKFIKVYTNIAFSDKYAGFITKTIVEGHTAPVAGSTYASGLQLSEERANNVRDYCLSAETGVDVSKISNTLEAVGYSNSKPVYDSNGNVNMAASRRVSFRFLVAVEI